MQDLTLVGLTEDKTRLVLVSDSGEKHTLPVDDSLRAALSGDDAPPGQLERQMDSALRPRDIQARIRAGESPETVAQAAQSTVDRIMRYASPVLAERAHIAERAQRASVRRKGSEGPARVLGDVVAEHLRGQNVDPDSVAWDSWRREDGRWMLVADVRVEERARHAEFIFDVQGRYVVPEDDEARWLVGDEVPRPVQRPRTAPGSSRRLSAVLPDEQLTLGDDAIELVTGEDQPEAKPPAGPQAGAQAGARAGSRGRPQSGRQAGAEAGREVGPDDRTVDLTETAWELRRGSSRRSARRAGTGDADWMATQASDRPARPARAVEDEPAPEEDTPATGAEPVTTGPAGSPTEQADRSEQPELPEEEPQSEPAPKKTTRKGRRASVPSWDEIMFGGGQSD
jgi:hypothetical protein